MKRRKHGPAEIVCHFGCDASVKGSPFRTPVPDIPSAYFVVCGPSCPERPKGAVVFDKNADR